MGNFIVKLFKFSLPYLILSVPLDFFISNNIAKSHDYPGEFEVWNDIYESNINCDIAIYGSSRCWLHINSEILKDTLNKKVYNLGVDGHNFWMSHLRHLEFLKNNNKPKLILISVDYFFLQKKEELYEMDQFLPYMLWNKNILEFTSSYTGYEKVDYYLPLVRFRSKSILFKIINENLTNKNLNERFRTFGFRGLDLKYRTPNDYLAQESKYQQDLDQKSINLFELFLENCKKSNIQVAFVYCPEYKLNQEFISKRDSAIKIYSQIANKNDFLFFDYSKDNFFSEKQEYFFDFCHLNSKGAKVFSSRLASDLKKEILNKNINF